jgi:TolB-like protein/Tfp pilus assembly protein PilF
LASFLRRDIRRFALLALSVAILTLGGVGVYLLARRDKTMDRAIDSVVVLPFTNTSANPDTEYLSDGITESLINSLSQLPNLRVMARSTVFRYKGKEVDPQKVGHDLRVQAAVTGRVQQRGNTLIIATELMDVEKGSQLWGGRYSRKVDDIFAIQEEISKAISDKLRLRLTMEEQKRLTKRYTEDTGAYEAYLKGRYYWNKRTEEALRKGIEYFQQAIAQDPGYALAYAGLSDSYNILGSYGYLSPKDASTGARAAATKALQIDDALAEAHTSLGYVIMKFDWDFLAAETEFKRALEINPSHVTAHIWYSYDPIYMGRRDEAITEMKRAIKADPLSLVAQSGLGRILYFVRQYDQAIAQLLRTLEMDPNFLIAHRFLGLTYMEKRMFKEAIEEFRRAALSEGSPETLAGLGHAYALSGRRNEALRIAQQLTGLSKQKYISGHEVAIMYLGLGDLEQAFAWLGKACQDRSYIVTEVKVDPKFDLVRSDPRFRDLLRRMKLDP